MAKKSSLGDRLADDLALKGHAGPSHTERSGEKDMDDLSRKTYDEAITWADLMATRGTLNPNSVRQQKTALRELTKVLQPDEPNSVIWVLENLNDLGKRLANADPKGA